MPAKHFSEFEIEFINVVKNAMEVFGSVDLARRLDTFTSTVCNWADGIDLPEDLVMLTLIDVINCQIVPAKEKKTELPKRESGDWSY